MYGCARRRSPTIRLVIDDDRLTDYDREMNNIYFVQVWAEHVEASVVRLRECRERLTQLLRLVDEQETDEWTDFDENCEKARRALWAAGHETVWAAHQLERWGKRHAEERGEEPRNADPVLRDVRNALEHLDEAYLFALAVAVPGPRGRNTSLKRLPRAELDLTSSIDGPLFGLIEPEELEERAFEYAAGMVDDLGDLALDRWIDDLVEAQNNPPPPRSAPAVGDGQRRSNVRRKAPPTARRPEEPNVVVEPREPK